MLKIWQEELQKVAHPEKIKIFQSFFKTGKGEYGEGDIFIGVSVPDNRKVAQKYFRATFDNIAAMLHHEIHEFRLSALLALVHRYKKEKNENEKQAIIDFYLDNSEWCNNWDLVDLSAPYLLGTHMLTHPTPSLLRNLSNDSNLWRQRIAIVSTLILIRNHRFDDTLSLCEKYLSHPHPLIHKATGWMLREIGKKDEQILLKFLDQHSTKMPRTALRYALERLSPEKRQYYMVISKKTK